jgi:hypothetical protein
VSANPTPPGDRHPSPSRGQWIAKHRRVAAGHFIRGLAYGTGAALAGVVGYALQQLL